MKEVNKTFITLIPKKEEVLVLSNILGLQVRVM